MPTVSYGRDVSCTTGLRSGRLVSGGRLVGEAVFRRLTTRRGTLRGGKDEADYGMQLMDEVGRNDAASVASLEGRIRQEVVKDARVLDCRARVVRTEVSAGRYALSVTVNGTLKAGPTFELVLAVSDVTVELVGLSTAGDS